MINPLCIDAAKNDADKNNRPAAEGLRPAPLNLQAQLQAQFEAALAGGQKKVSPGRAAVIKETASDVESAMADLADAMANFMPEEKLPEEKLHEEKDTHFVTGHEHEHKYEHEHEHKENDSNLPPPGALSPVRLPWPAVDAAATQCITAMTLPGSPRQPAPAKTADRATLSPFFAARADSVPPASDSQSDIRSGRDYLPVAEKNADLAADSVSLSVSLREKNFREKNFHAENRREKNSGPTNPGPENFDEENFGEEKAVSLPGVPLTPGDRLLAGFKSAPSLSASLSESIEHLALYIHTRTTRQGADASFQLTLPLLGTLEVTMATHAGELRVAIASLAETQKQLARSQNELLERLQRLHPAQTVQLSFSNQAGSEQGSRQRRNVFEEWEYTE